MLGYTDEETPPNIDSPNEVVCTAMDNCADHDCTENGDCISIIGTEDYECACHLGYYDKSGSDKQGPCRNIDECDKAQSLKNLFENFQHFKKFLKKKDFFF